jgi:hypothetical protein
MLFVRRETLPKTSLTSSSSSSSVQFTDVGGWASAGSTRKIVLSRSTSTLSSGLYYVGVYNSEYARGSLGYRLTVNGAEDCETSTLVASFDSVVDDINVSGFSSGSQNVSVIVEDEDLGVCSNGGVCSTQSSQLCTCADGHAGYYCSLQPTRATLSPASALGTGNLSSYAAFETADNSTLAVGEWMYYSFDVNDTSAAAVEFVLQIQNDIAQADTPVRPVILVRGPNDAGFPSLAITSMQDF